MGKLITYGSLLTYLVYTAFRDWKTKQVSVGIAKAALGCGVLFWLLFHPIGFVEWIFGILPGLGMLFLGAISHESIGYGDGIVACVCGTFLGFWGCMQVLVTGLFLSGPISLFLIASGRAGRKTRIAFVPFLLLGYLAWLVMKV